MPTDRDPLYLDERTARLGRELFADVRQEQQREAAEKRRPTPTAADTTDDSSPFDWLFGDGDADGDGDSGD